ncbi:MAG: hypothetical protein ACP6IU_02515 [Candidatus Asgardarchaeia archaeon]
MTPYIIYEEIKKTEILYRDSPIPISILTISLSLFWIIRLLEFHLTGTFSLYTHFFLELPVRISLFLVLSFFAWIFWLKITQFLLPRG